MPTIGDIRVGVDWENKGVISWDATASTPLNQAPLILEYGTMGDAEAVISVVPYINPQQIDSFTTFAIRIQFTQVSGQRSRAVWFPNYIGLDWATNRYANLWVSGIADRIGWFNFNTTTGVNTQTGAWDYSVQTSGFRLVSHVNSTTMPSAGEQRAFIVYGDPGDDFYIYLMQHTNAATTAYSSSVSVSRYDNITPYVRGFDTSLGKSSWDASFVDDGTATIKLKNESKIFSIENTGSPLYGWLLRGRRLVIQVYLGSDIWRVLWTGYTSEYSIDAKSNSARGATLVANQALERITTRSYTQPFVANTAYTSTDALKDLIRGVEFTPVSFVYAGVVDQSAADMCYVYADSLLNALWINVSGTPVPLKWIETDTLSGDDAVRSLSELEGGGIYLDRAGRMRVRTRDWLKNTAAPAATPISYFNDLTYYLFQEPVTAITLSFSQFGYYEFNNAGYVQRTHTAAGAPTFYTEHQDIYAIHPEWVEHAERSLTNWIVFPTFYDAPPLLEHIYFTGASAISSPHTLYDDTNNEYIDAADAQLTWLPKDPYQTLFRGADLKITFTPDAVDLGNQFLVQAEIYINGWMNLGDVTETFYNPNQTGSLSGKLETKNNIFLFTREAVDAYLDGYWSKRAVTQGWFLETEQVFTYGEDTALLSSMLAIQPGSLITFDYTPQATPTTYKVQVAEGERWSYSDNTLIKRTVYSLRG